MAANSVPREIRQFISRHIHTVEHVEVLCLLSHDSGRSWSVSHVLRGIQSSEKSVSACLEEFRNAGLVVSEPTGEYRFLPNDPQAARTVSELVKAYRERRISVIECIYGKPKDPIEDFANAFRPRREK